MAGVEQWIDFRPTLSKRISQTLADTQQSQVKQFSLRGHALIRGAAGAGKSFVLGQRAAQLAADPAFERILVLTYNRYMAGWLGAHLEPISDRITCTTFHRWAFQALDYRYGRDNSATGRASLVAAAEQCSLRYQAILIDEAQDFYDEWFVALLKVLDPETNSLFLVYDNAQAIYGQAHRRRSDWSWRKLGIEVAGRSQILDTNYRNSPEIAATAWAWMVPTLAEHQVKVVTRSQAAGHVAAVIEPQILADRSAKILPRLVALPATDPAGAIATQVQQALATHPSSSLGILVQPGAKALRQAISDALAAADIVHHAPQQSQDRDGRVVDCPYVVVDVWSALKGVEFDGVIVVLDQGDAGDTDAEEPANSKLPRRSMTPTEQHFAARAGLYSAMTRARDCLVIAYRQPHEWVAELAEAIAHPAPLQRPPLAPNPATPSAAPTSPPAPNHPQSDQPKPDPSQPVQAQPAPSPSAKSKAAESKSTPPPSAESKAAESKAAESQAAESKTTQPKPVPSKATQPQSAPSQSSASPSPLPLKRPNPPKSATP